ncbi:MAG: Rab family GTPase [Candidatus Hodarchaeales archaeon]|jgi:small GTP-binding protein
MYYKHSIKLILLGDPSVGKTSLVKRFVDDAFKADYKPTLGTEIYGKEKTIEDEPILFQIWDLSGHQSFKNIRMTFYQKADAAFLICDLTRQETLTNLDRWTEEVNKAIGYYPLLIIIGNKIDLDLAREISSDNLEKFALEKNCEFIETSARTGDNVNKAFEIIALQYLEQNKEN